MNITETKINFVSNRADKLKAFCSITLDGEFVIRDIRIIEGNNGGFIAMPSRKLMSKCPNCGGKNHLRATFCNDCGKKLPDNRIELNDDGRPKLHADIAHPINTACRAKLQNFIMREYENELDRAQQTGRAPEATSDNDNQYDNGNYFEQPPSDTRSNESQQLPPSGIQ